ncbi:uncharacterized protein LOC144903774 [Branchiostoma floridae x Branchiostoma belcheri]
MQYYACPRGALLWVCAVLLSGSWEVLAGGCNLSPCRHGGTCVSLEGAHAYRCECPAEYVGQHCDFLLAGCGHQVGLADGSVTDSQLSVSSALDKNDPQGGAGRLHGVVPWRPSADDSDPWIQVDLNVTSTVVGVITEGIRQQGSAYYVTRFTVSSSLDGVKWSPYTDPASYRDIQFPVNSVKVTTTRFESALTARYFRLYPTNSTVPGDIRLKLDLLTCKDDCSHLRAPCLQNSTCTNDQGVHDFTCTCQDGFHGDRCGQMDKYRTCPVPLGLGMDILEISDDQLSASSQKNAAVGPGMARLDYRKGGWRPDLTDSQPWIQVDLLRPTLVTGVVTQGRTGIWVETYKIGYSDVTDGGSFAIYKNPDGSDKVFEGNLNDGDTMRNDVSPPIRARYIRVIPHSWSPPGIKLRLELLTCDYSYCSTAMGVQSGAVTDDQMSASSFKAGYQPWRARLNGTRAWQMDPEDRGQWLQIDLLRDVLVTGVQTQGLKGGNVESYRLMYSGDGTTFVTYKNSTGQDMIFDGHTDGDTVMTHELSRPVVARYLRFNPHTWKARYPRMRVEVLGCNGKAGADKSVYRFIEIPVSPPSNVNTTAAPTAVSVTSATSPVTASSAQPNTAALTIPARGSSPSLAVTSSTGKPTEQIAIGSSTALTEAPSTAAVPWPTPSWTVPSIPVEACNQPLGLVSGAIADGQLTASSAQPGYEAFKARINGTRSWHMAQLDTQQWLQVDLGQLKIVTGIQTQGKWGGHVKSYRLLFHGQDTTGNWTVYTQPGGGQVLEGNSDGDSIVQHDLHVPMVTRYLRVNPVTWPGVLPRLRMEVLGCNIYPDCYHALGMEDGGITDGQVTASSAVPGSEAWRARLHGRGPGAWLPKAGDEKPWLQIDLLQPTVVTGLETQPLWDGPTNYLPTTEYRIYWYRKFQLFYSDDSNQWTVYSDSSRTVSDGSPGTGYVMRHTLATPVVTRYLRFHPLKFPGAPQALRLEVLGCTGGWNPTPLPLVTTESHVTPAQLPQSTAVAPFQSATSRLPHTSTTARPVISTTTPVRKTVPQSTTTKHDIIHTTEQQTALPTDRTTAVPPEEKSSLRSTSTTRLLTTPAQTVARSATKQPLTESTTLRVTNSRTTEESRSSTASTPAQTVARSTARQPLTESTTLRVTSSRTTEETRPSTASTIFHSATKSTPDKKTESPIVKAGTKGTITKGVTVPSSTLLSSTRMEQDHTTRKTATEQLNNGGTTQSALTERRTTTGKLNRTDEFRSSEKRDKQRSGSARILYITVGVIGGAAVIAVFIALVACSRAKRPKRTDRVMLMEEFSIDSSPLHNMGEFIDASDNPTNDSVTEDTTGLLEHGGDNLIYQT